jgi:hypothetical protein
MVRFRYRAQPEVSCIRANGYRRSNCANSNPDCVKNKKCGCNDVMLVRSRSVGSYMNRLAVLFWILVTFLLTGSLLAAEATTGKGETALKILGAEGLSGRVQYVEVLWCNPSAESRSTITPELLDKTYFRKVLITRFSQNVMAKELLYAIQKTSLGRLDSTSDGDVRWAIKFYERKSNSPFAEIYLDGSGEIATIGGSHYSVNSFLIDWLNENFFKLPTVPKNR